MGKSRFIAQDRWCDICSRPAALLVVTSSRDDPKPTRPVCSNKHGEMLIDQLNRADKAEKEGRVPIPLEEE